MNPGSPGRIAFAVGTPDTSWLWEANTNGRILIRRSIEDVSWGIMSSLQGLHLRVSRVDKNNPSDYIILILCHSISGRLPPFAIKHAVNSLPTSPTTLV